MNLNDKAALLTLRDRILEALKPLEAEVSVKFEVGKIRFDPDGATATFPINARAGVALEKDDYQRDFDRGAHRFNLDASHLGKSFVSAGKTFTLHGLCLSRPKYVVAAKRADGSITFFPAGILKAIRPEQG